MQNLFGVKGELDEDQIAQLLMESGPNNIIEIPEETKPGCLSDDEILRFIDHEVTENERTRIEHHMGGCKVCHSMWYLIYRGGHPEG